MGSFARVPVTDPWHEVTITLLGEHVVQWSNEAGVSWTFARSGRELVTADSVYGVGNLFVELDGETLVGLWYNGELYSVAD